MEIQKLGDLEFNINELFNEFSEDKLDFKSTNLYYLNLNNSIERVIIVTDEESLRWLDDDLNKEKVITMLTVFESSIPEAYNWFKVLLNIIMYRKENKNDNASFISSV